MHHCLESQWNSLKRILRHLNGTLEFGSHIQKASRLDLVAFYDSDWASDPDDKCSTLGHCIFYYHNLILGNQLSNILYLNPLLKQSLRVLPMSHLNSHG